jgi:hypothetical protein
MSLSLPEQDDEEEDGAVIIDSNGLERVMSASEEEERRMDLQRAVREKMSSGFIAPISRSNSANPLQPKPMANDIPTANDAALTSLPAISRDKEPFSWLGEEAQKKATIVGRLSRLGFGKKRSSRLMSRNSVMSFGAILEAA